MGNFFSLLFSSSSQACNSSTISDDVNDQSLPYDSHESEESYENTDTENNEDSTATQMDSEESNEVEQYVEETEPSSELQKSIFTPNGNKYAVVIGINYKDNESDNDDLYGCINDVNNICDMLQSKCHFHDDQIMKLVGPAGSKKNIMDAIDLLTQYSQTIPNSELWFSYSGHGGGKFSLSEQDNQSEFICPYDYLENGLIDDSWLKENFVNKLEKTSKCFALMDCCNSGSNLNLPYVYNNDDEDARSDNTLAKVIKISGSRDDQTSADYFDVDSMSYQGALTNNFLKNLSNDPIKDVFHNLRTSLFNEKFTQRPELTYTNGDLINFSLSHH